MRRLSLVWSLPLVALAAACGAAPAAAPAVAPVPSAPVSVTSAGASPVAHAPAPAIPPGVEAGSVDSSVSPCNDFFAYACGGWVKQNPIPDDQAEWGRFNLLADSNREALRKILERDAAKGGGSDPYAAALGDFYGSCVDEDAVEKDGVRALAPELKRIEGVGDAASLARTLARLHRIGVDAFFDLGVEQDFKDATQEIAAVDQAGLGMPDRDYYLVDDPKMAALRDKYVVHLERVLALLGDAPEAAKREAQTIFALEKTLAQAHMSRVDARDPEKVYHRMDRAGLAKAAPALPWDVYFKEVGAPGASAINVYQPDYMGAISKHVAEATKATWADEIRPYLRAHLAMALAPALTKRFVEEDFGFEREFTGQAKMTPRWKRCVRAVDRGMGEALAVPFVRERLGAEGKQATVDAVAGIEAAMLADLATLPWMDDATRARAVEKVHKIANKIGYPDHWRKYDTLKVERASYATNIIHAHEFETARALAKIGKPVDRSEWGLTPPTVNAYYNPMMNEMVFPAGILQTPFYSASATPAVNFGAIGMVMGHELTHGFDDQGRKFDGDGNMKDWWTASINAEFVKRASCVSDQFDAVVAVDDVHLNGKLTLGENLADLGGLKLALAALHAKVPATPEVDRQFFFGYAQSWCDSRRPELARLYATTDPHSPSEARVNEPLKNMSAFASAFACTAGDKMVRSEEKKCTVW